VPPKGSMAGRGGSAPLQGKTTLTEPVDLEFAAGRGPKPEAGDKPNAG
jgi:hypothetical protein